MTLVAQQRASPMRTWYAVLFLTAACGGSTSQTRQQPHDAVLFRESFSDPATLPRAWGLASSSAPAAQVRFDEEAAALTLPGETPKGEVRLRRVFDLAPLRGQRIRLTARARTSAASATASAVITASSIDGRPSYGDRASTRDVHGDLWTTIDTTLDVAPHAVSGELVLVLQGAGTAWFDDVSIVTAGSSPPARVVQLSDQQVVALTALARAAAYVRYLHPSDQSASLDWDAFLPGAVRRVLEARDPSAVTAQLAQVFARIAPTARFYRQGRPPSIDEIPRGSHLARWHRVGLG